MRVIDIDPELLSKSAAAAVHAGSEGWRHMEAEFLGDIPNLMTTLKAEGPYAYTIMPQVFPDGSVKSPILCTRDEIHEAYKLVRGASDLLSSEAMIEIRGAWYQFTEALTRGRRKGQDEIAENRVISLFPVSSGKGITGELVWVRVDPALMGIGPAPANASKDETTLRRQLLALHDQYCAGLRSSDAEAVVQCLADGAQGAIRDYVNDTGTLIELDGTAASLAYYKALFEKYRVLSVELLQRVTQEWYMFAELRLEVQRCDSAEKLVFNMAEFLVPAKDGRFILRVGHGADPASPTSG